MCNVKLQAFTQGFNVGFPVVRPAGRPVGWTYSHVIANISRIDR